MKKETVSTGHFKTQISFGRGGGGPFQTYQIQIF